MPSLVIKSVPEALYAQLKETASEHRRSVAQEALVLLNEALNQRSLRAPRNYWSERKLLPEWEEALANGAFADSGESTESISDERDAT